MPQARPKLFRQVIKIVFVLLGISAGLIVGAVHSEKFARSLLELIIDRASDDGQLKISVVGFAGTLAAGLKAESVRLIRLHPASDISIKDLRAGLNFERLFPAGVLSLSGRTGHIDVAGMNPPWLKLFKLPAYHGPACFANLPANIEIRDFSVASIKLLPWAELPASINISSFTVVPGQSAGENVLDLALTAEWRAMQIASGTISGTLKQRQSRFEGTANICFAGQKMITEICLQQKRKKTELSGHIASASINLSTLSLWLGPLWQNEFPFGFDGRFDCSGSWLFNPELGFLGNLAGKCERVRLVALGFYFSLVELNGNWKLFDGSFIFNDSGSFFAGFPATLEGLVESVMKPGRNWRFNFACPEIDFAQLSGELPWGLKYSLNLPELSGTAALSMSLNGKSPDILCKATTAALKIGKNGAERVVSGQATFLQHGLGTSSLALDFEAVSSSAVPPFFSRFHGRGGGLSAKLDVGSGPYLFKWNMSGPPAHLIFSGRFAADSVEMLSTKGNWRGGIGHLSASSGSSDSPAKYSADGITFLDLLLAR